MKYNSCVIINYGYDNHFDAEARYRTYTLWLDDRNIKYEGILEDFFSVHPPVIISMDAEDAVAFKLRFGIQ